MGELREICVIRWNLTGKDNLKIVLVIFFKGEKRCTVKPYHIFKREIWTFCRKASLPFPGEMDLGCGITFDIFTHVFTRVVFFNLLEYIHM